MSPTACLPSTKTLTARTADVYGVRSAIDFRLLIRPHAFRRSPNLLYQLDMGPFSFVRLFFKASTLKN